MRRVFVTGSTGYMGARLIARLLERGHQVKGLTRRESAGKLPGGCTAVEGNALEASTYADAVRGCDTFVHLVGVAHPSPAKAAEFRSIDLVSIQQAVTAAAAARVEHFIYLSVAQPAPIMKEYIAVRAEGERLVSESGMHATFLRPWYVLGPGHRWPYLLLPFYWLMWWHPSSRRLYPTTIARMVATLVWAVENPASGARVVESTGFRSA
jgi:uncharacterized protein YbjT (DUF2867 family)